MEVLWILLMGELLFLVILMFFLISLVELSVCIDISIVVCLFSFIKKLLVYEVFCEVFKVDEIDNFLFNGDWRFGIIEVVKWICFF